MYSGKVITATPNADQLANRLGIVQGRVKLLSHA